MFYGWVVAVMCGLGMGLSGPGHSFYFVNFSESFIADAGIPRLSLSFMWTVCLFAAAAWQPLGGKLIDRFGARKCMLAMVVPYAASIYGLGQVGGKHALAMLAALFFVVRSCGPGWLNTMLVKIFNAWFDKKRGRASMILVFCNNAEMLAVPGTRAAISHFGWRRTYALMACVVTVGMIVLLAFTRNRPEALGLVADGTKAPRNASESPVRSPQKSSSGRRVLAPTGGVSFRSACKTPMYGALLSSSLLYGINWGGLNFHAAAAFAEQGLLPGDLSLAYAIMSGAGLVASLVSGAAIDKLKHKNRLQAFAILLGAIAPALCYLRDRDNSLPRWLAVLGCK
jgi:MFS family permease